jgi:protein translocase, SecG subunit
MQNILMIVHIVIVFDAHCGRFVATLRGRSACIGGGGGQGAFMSGRSAANVMTRTTAILAFLFVCSSLGLAWTAGTFKSDSLEDEIKRLESSGGSIEEGTSAPLEAPKPLVPLTD